MRSEGPAAAERKDVDVGATSAADAWPEIGRAIELGSSEPQATLGERFAALVRRHRGIADPSALTVCAEHRLSKQRAFVAVCTVGASCFACSNGVELYDLHRIGSAVHVDARQRGEVLTAFGRLPTVRAIAIGPGVPGFLVRGTLCHGGSCEERVELFSLVALSGLPEDPGLFLDLPEERADTYTPDDRRNYHGIYKSAEIAMTTSNTGQDCRTERCFELTLRVALQASRHGRYKDLRVELDGKAALLDGDAMIPVRRQWLLPFDGQSYRVPHAIHQRSEE